MFPIRTLSQVPKSQLLPMFSIRTVSQVPKSQLHMASSSSSSSWACAKCTFLNPSTETLRCCICDSFRSHRLPAAGTSSSSSISTSPSPSPSPSSSAALTPRTWSCRACTFSNPTQSTSCDVCGTRRNGPFFFPSAVIDLEPDELADPSVGSVFFPLQRCGSKRPLTVKSRGEDRQRQHPEKVARMEEDEVVVIRAVGNAAPTSNQGMLKILSYNVWFREDLEGSKRMQALGDLIEHHSPDFICLQEVTPNIYRLFQNSSWWKAYKCSVSQDMANERAYFCMQMSKLPVKAFNCIPFSNSIMGRELCLANIDSGMGKELVIATSHLESPSPAPPKWDQMYSTERVAQAKQAVSLLKDSPNVVFGGDMNWDDKRDGSFPLPEGWVDVWAELKPGESGWTYDTKANKMLSGNRALQKRLDRFICSLSDFKIKSIEMIGTEAIPGLSYCKDKKVRNELKKLVLPVLPSDHYGLLLTICSL